MARVAPSERFRMELVEALAGVGQEQDPVETIGRLGARPSFISPGARLKRIAPASIASLG